MWHCVDITVHNGTKGPQGGYHQINRKKKIWGPNQRVVYLFHCVTLIMLAPSCSWHIYQWRRSEGPWLHSDQTLVVSYQHLLQGRLLVHSYLFLVFFLQVATGLTLRSCQDKHSVQLKYQEPFSLPNIYTIPRKTHQTSTSKVGCFATRELRNHCFLTAAIDSRQKFRSFRKK